MKTLKLSIILLVLLGAFSCKKIDGGSNVTVDQAADLAATSLSQNSDGLATISDNLAINAQGVAPASINGSPTVNSVGISTIHQECGTTLVDSVTNSGSNGSATFSYFFKFSRTLNCNANNQPDNLNNAIVFHGDFDGPRLTTSGSGTATVKIAGLTQSAASFVLTGEYKRAGSFQSKVGNKVSGQSNIDIVITDLTLTKPTRKIASGHGTISITGSTTKNGAYSYTGTIVFNGDGTATLTVNGNSYTVTLETGICAKH